MEIISQLNIGSTKNLPQISSPPNDDPSLLGLKPHLEAQLECGALHLLEETPVEVSPALLFDALATNLHILLSTPAVQLPNVL